MSSKILKATNCASERRLHFHCCRGTCLITSMPLFTSWPVVHAGDPCSDFNHSLTTDETPSFWSAAAICPALSIPNTCNRPVPFFWPPTRRLPCLLSVYCHDSSGSRRNLIFSLHGNSVYSRNTPGVVLVHIRRNERHDLWSSHLHDSVSIAIQDKHR